MPPRKNLNVRRSAASGYHLNRSLGLYQRRHRWRIQTLLLCNVLTLEMSLCAQSTFLIPVETERVARAAFPKGTLCLHIINALGSIFCDPQFASLFPRRGQLAEAPARLALITLLQFVENLPDRQAADAVRGRIDWKYALALELTDPGFHYTVLSEFRTRLIAGNAELLLLDTLLDRFKELDLIKTRGRQRTDSTHVMAAVRSLNRLEQIGRA